MEGRNFPMDSVERELSLVALEAAGLSRRLFPPPVRRRDLSVAARQALLLLALVDTASTSQMGLTTPEIGAAVAMDREEALDAMAELVALSLARACDEWEVMSEDEAAEDYGYCLTAGGMVAATELVERVRHFLPGWPPRAKAPTRIELV